MRDMERKARQHTWLLGGKRLIGASYYGHSYNTARGKCLSLLWVPRQSTDDHHSDMNGLIGKSNSGLKSSKVQNILAWPRPSPRQQLSSRLREN